MGLNQRPLPCQLRPRPQARRRPRFFPRGDRPSARDEQSTAPVSTRTFDDHLGHVSAHGAPPSAATRSRRTVSGSARRCACASRRRARTRGGLGLAPCRVHAARTPGTRPNVRLPGAGPTKVRLGEETLRRRSHQPSASEPDCNVPYRFPEWILEISPRTIGDRFEARARSGRGDRASRGSKTPTQATCHADLAVITRPIAALTR